MLDFFRYIIAELPFASAIALALFISLAGTEIIHRRWF